MSIVRAAPFTAVPTTTVSPPRRADRGDDLGDRPRIRRTAAPDVRAAPGRWPCAANRRCRVRRPAAAAPRAASAPPGGRARHRRHHRGHRWRRHRRGGRRQVRSHASRPSRAVCSASTVGPRLEAVVPSPVHRPTSIPSTATVARNVRVAMPEPSWPASSGRTTSASAASGEPGSFVTAIDPARVRDAAGPCR